MNKLIKTVIGVSLAGTFGFLFLKDINPTELLNSLYQVDFVYISLATIIFFIGYACRIERWKIMLNNDNPDLTWKSCFTPMFISVAANNILPFRLGDLIRAFAFNKHLNISTSTSITTLLIERLLDLLMVIVILGLTFPYLNEGYSTLVGVGGLGLFFIGSSIVILINFPNLIKPIPFGIVSILKACSIELGNKAENVVKNIFSALIYISKGSTTIKLIFWSMAAWICEGIVFWLVAFSIPNITNTLAAWLALPIGTLATIIPSTPGYIGTFDYFTAEAMIVAGNSKVSSTVYALVVHLIIWVPPTVVGGLCFLVKPIMSTSDIRKLS